MQGALTTLQEAPFWESQAAGVVEVWELIDVQSAEDYAGNPYLLFVCLELPGHLDSLSPVATRAGPEQVFVPNRPWLSFEIITP